MRLARFASVFRTLTLPPKPTVSALFVGDNESDVEAARRAGLDSAFVRREHAAGVELSVEPTYEVEDLHGVAKIANGG